MPGPGVTVTTSVRAGASQSLRAPSGQLFIVGQAERGDTTKPVVLRGLADYEQLLGGRVAYGNLYDQLKTYFAEGGLQAIAQRVVGPAATTGTLTLQDRAGTPVNTLRVDAANPGAWSSRVTVEVMDGSIANTFRVIVRLDGVTVEDKTNLGSPTAAVNAFAASSFVRLTSLGSASVAPTNNPKVLAATALSAGNDDRAAVTNTHYLAALEKFSPGLGDGAVAIPGVGTGVHAGLIAHAVANRRVALLGAGLNDSIATLTTTAAANAVNGDHAMLAAPWIRVSDEAGGYREISPEGYAAACRARAHEQVGPWQAAAGKIAAAATILGLSQTFTKAETDQLDAARVSAIRVVADGIRLYGWRSLSTDEENFKYLSARDTLNRLAVLGEAALEEFVYAPIDNKGQLLSSINAALVGIAEPMRVAGGLYSLTNAATGSQIDPGYRVETGSSINTPQSLANNEVKARLAVRVAPTGALVNLTIVKIGVLSGL